MFEVQDLKFATLATVSRCGMVWFSEDVLNLEMIFEHHLIRMRNISIDDAEDTGIRPGRAAKSDVVSPTLQVEDSNMKKVFQACVRRRVAGVSLGLQSSGIHVHVCA